MTNLFDTTMMAMTALGAAGGVVAGGAAGLAWAGRLSKYSQVECADPNGPGLGFNPIKLVVLAPVLGVLGAVSGMYVGGIAGTLSVVVVPTAITVKGTRALWRKIIAEDEEPEVFEF
jgi:hypothetical protein